MNTYTYAQDPKIKILIIGKGQAWEEQDHREILNYFKDDHRSFSFVDGETADWKTFGLDEYDIVWLHRADSSYSAYFDDNKDYYKALLSYVNEGGKILLTQHALSFINKSGLEEEKVQHRIKVSSDNGYGRMLGFHAFRNHPLFDSLHGGAYVWKPPTDTIVTQCGFFEDRIPKNGKVIAVDWDYIFVRESSKLILEYELGKGKILGIGAYFNLFTPNLNRLHFDVFYDNVFSYLTGEKKNSEEYFWLYGDQHIGPLDFVLKHQLIPPKAKRWDFDPSPLTLSRDKAKKEYCEVAGRRILVAAYEPGGIFELWAHPFMAFRDYKVSLYFENDTIIHLGDLLPSIDVSPECVIRIYHLKNKFTLKEILTVSPNEPVGVIHYEYDGPEANLGIHYKSNMRLMWPYSENVLRTLKHGYDPSINALEINAPEANLLTIIGASKIPISKYSGPTNNIDPSFPQGEIVPGTSDQAIDTLFEISAGQLFQLGGTDQLDILFAAGNEDRDTIIKAYMSALRDPQSILLDSRMHYNDLQDNMLSIITPDENFNKGYSWALAATDRFFVKTPGIGTSLVAGYNGTDRGWDGGHKVNGRPGYAWYFGRDAVWSAFAVLDYGDHEGVKDVLDMLIKFQDLNGKIFHELSTSGFVHYDASDATPLFIILAGRYLEYSGDADYIQSIWPAIIKAMQYCESTDTDDDGLIENTNVGHGWVEGGHLFGSHTSLYLASCWAEACRYYSKMAFKLGKDSLGSLYRDKSHQVRERLENSFYDHKSGYLYQGIHKDGSFHKEESIMPAVSMYLLALKDSMTNTMLRLYAGHEYSSDWGVRMASIYNEHYHPRGYHSGAVWPLYTGWVALAEYKYGRSLQGFSHIINNLNNYRDFSLGYTEEVLNGEKYSPSGVCSHQCWSETMVLQPIIEGMLGYTSGSIVRLAPSFPPQWNEVKVENIKYIDHGFDMKMTRYPNRTVFSFTNINVFTSISFDPKFIPGTMVEKVEVNGKKLKIDQDRWLKFNSISAVYPCWDDTEIIIYHSGGISLIPPSEKPALGEESRSIRILNDNWEDNTYTIEIEGAAGMQYKLEVINNFGTPKSINGASFKEEGNRLLLEVRFPAMNRNYQAKTIKISF